MRKNTRGEREGRVAILQKSALAFCKSNVTSRESSPTLGAVIGVLYTEFLRQVIGVGMMKSRQHRISF